MTFSYTIAAGQSHVTAQLVTASQDFSRPFEVGIYFSLEPDWYLYWKNPGDAGLPLAVTWSLPEGFRVDELEYPIPQKILHGDILSFGYYRELLLRCRITPPNGERPHAGNRISAKLDWLVCKESCVRGGATVFLDLTASTAAERKHAVTVVSRFAARMPAPLASLGLTATGGVRMKDGEQETVRITLQGANRATVTDFFPESIDEYVIDHKRIAVSDGTITISLTPYSHTASLKFIRGVVLAGKKGYTLSVPVEQQQQ